MLDPPSSTLPSPIWPISPERVHASQLSIAPGARSDNVAPQPTTVASMPAHSNAMPGDSTSALGTPIPLARRGKRRRACGRWKRQGANGDWGVTVYVAIIALMIAGYWRTFEKAGQPGWAAIIPIYNVYILLKLVGRPGWWLVLYLIPVVTFVVDLIVSLDLATSFGRGAGFGVGLWLLPWIFVPILGLGSATYGGPGSRAPGQPLALS